MLVSALWVALGGALGSVARFLVSQLTARTLGTQFPWGTLVVNVVGCFLFGVLAGLLTTRGPFAAPARLFLLVGVMGGFTTYSSFAFETIELLDAGRGVPAMASIAGQLLLGMTALSVGLMLTR